MAVGCMGTRVHVAHARTLMCMLGCLSNLVMGYFEKTFLLAVTRTRASSLAFSPLSLPLTLCLQAEGGLLYLDEDAGTAGSCWQAVEREVCSLDLHRPPAVCTFARADRGQGCGACVGRSFGSWTCLPPSPPMGAQWPKVLPISGTTLSSRNSKLGL